MQTDWLALYSAVMVLVAIMFKLAIHNALDIKRERHTLIEEDLRLAKARLADAEERRQAAESTWRFMARRKASLIEELEKTRKKIALQQAALAEGEIEAENKTEIGETTEEALHQQDEVATGDREEAVEMNVTTGASETSKEDEASTPKEDEASTKERKEQQILGPEDRIRRFAAKNPDRQIKGPDGKLI